MERGICGTCGGPATLIISRGRKYWTHDQAKLWPESYDHDIAVVTQVAAV